MRSFWDVSIHSMAFFVEFFTRSGTVPGLHLGRNECWEGRLSVMYQQSEEKMFDQSLSICL